MKPHIHIYTLAAVLLVLISSISARADYKSTVLADNPIAYYALDLTIDNAGTATDLSGNGNNSAYYNIYPVTGPSIYITNAAQFQGASVLSYVDLGSGTNTAILNFGGLITYEAWVQPASSSSFGDILAKGYDANQNYDENVLRVQNGYYYGGTGGGGALGGTQSTNWIHLVSTYDGTNWNLYVNGALAATAASGSGAINFSDPWAIGTGSADGNTRYFSGNICQVALYTNALTPAQIQNHYWIGKYGSTNFAPVIISEPVPSVSDYVGATTTFSVGVDSALPVSYQWYKGVMLLTGQTNAALTLADVQSGDAASYTVIVSNTAGSNTSAPAALSVFTPGAYGAAVIANSPAAYYPLNETSGTTAIDYAGDGLNGNYVNSPLLAASGPSAYIQAAVTFDGSSQNVNLPNQAPLNFGGPIAMEAWIKPSALAQFGDIVAKGYDGNQNDDEIVLRNQNGTFYGGVGQIGASGGLSSTSSWTYLVGENDGTNWSLYVNGILVSQTPNSSGAINFSDPWAIASGSASGNTRYFPGEVSQVAIYSHALTASQILSHYQFGLYGTTNLPPQIVKEPPATNSAYAGDTVTISATVSSGIPVTYAWYEGQTLLPTQTNESLVLPNVTTNSAGSYHLVATSQAGSTTSSNAQLNVYIMGAYIPSQYAQTVLAANPVAYYPLDEIAGTTAYERSGRALNGTYVNGPGLGVAGPTALIPLAVNFDGASQFVNLGTQSTLEFAGPITMEAWVNPNSSTLFGDICAQGYDANNGDAELVMRANSGNYYAAGNGSVGGGTQTTAWTYLVCACDGTNWNMYINGTLVSTGPGSGAQDLTDPWAIADGTLNGANRFFGGAISQFALYNYALTPLQVEAHFYVGQYGIPTINGVAAINGALVASGKNGVPNDNYTVLTTTNLLLPVSSWVPAQTNTVNGDGTFSFTNTITPGMKQQYFRIQLQ